MKTTIRLTIAAFGLAIFNVSAATLYVSLESTHPVVPYATWATAATNIQDAVDVARNGDTVLVTNGVYVVGGRDDNRVAITNTIRLESVNGPLVTTIEGGGGARCVYLGSNAVLSGLTLTNGNCNFDRGGGGVFCEPSGVVTNCTLTGNSATWGGGVCGGTLYNCTVTGNLGGRGGGAYASTLYKVMLSGNRSKAGPTFIHMFGYGGGACASTLYNCTLTGNSATWEGGGVYRGTLYNCTLRGNLGGGASGTLYNCIVTGNEGGSGGVIYNCTVVGNNGGASGTVFNSIVYYNAGGNYDTNTTLNYCCTTPLPTNGVGNITGPPLFMDMASGDFRLWEGSPCIDAGMNLMGFTSTITNADGSVIALSYTCEPTDILGNTRFIDANGDGIVAWDIGAYEFDSFPPPRFTCAPQRMPDCWRLSITGAPNKWVRLVRSSDLKNWEDVWVPYWTPSAPYIFMGSAGVKQVDDTDLSQTAMFYRVIVE